MKLKKEKTLNLVKIMKSHVDLMEKLEATLQESI